MARRRKTGVTAWEVYQQNSQSSSRESISAALTELSHLGLLKKTSTTRKSAFSRRPNTVYQYSN